MTKLDKPLRRELEIASRLYTLTLDREGMRLKRKGHRHGMHIGWAELAAGLDDPPGTTPASAHGPGETGHASQIAD